MKEEREEAYCIVLELLQTGIEACRELCIVSSCYSTLYIIN